MGVANGPLTPFADGVWVDTGPVRFLGLQLTATMAVLRLGDASPLLYAPLAMTPERRAAVEGLGRVAHLLKSRARGGLAKENELFLEGASSDPCAGGFRDDADRRVKRDGQCAGYLGVSFIKVPTAVAK
jgi:hypothetical protein